MDAVFLKLLNMSLTASWLCLAVLILRLLLKRAPKAISCALWALVGLRLLFPFSLESVLSLIPSAEPLPEDMLLSPTPTINSGIPVINEVVNPVISGSLAPTPGDSVNPMQVITTVAGYLWVIGMIAMLVYMLASYLRVKSKVAEAAKIEGNVYECDHIDTPFILGVIRPRIYLPSSMNEADRAFVIAHEQAHLRRLDHLWKPLGFVLLTVYWFNPLLWLGYILLCRDIELACDEKVIRQLGTDVKKQYSEALINCSVPRRAISACPLAFGEVGVKGRIKSVLNYKKPAFWIILVAVVALVVTGVCFLTDPLKEDPRVQYYNEYNTYGAGITANGTFWFTGDILEINEDTFLVRPHPKSFEYQISKKISVPRATSSKYDDAYLQDLKIGDDVYIYYTGKITNSDPAQIKKVHKVELEASRFVGQKFYENPRYTVLHDVDNDGKKEYCVIAYGPYAGTEEEPNLRSISIHVWNKKATKLEYSYDFTAPYYNIQLIVRPDETLWFGDGLGYYGDYGTLAQIPQQLVVIDGKLQAVSPYDYLLGKTYDEVVAKLGTPLGEPTVQKESQNTYYYYSFPFTGNVNLSVKFLENTVTGQKEVNYYFLYTKKTTSGTQPDTTQPSLSYTAWNFEATPEFTLPEFDGIRFVSEGPGPFGNQIKMINGAGDETKLIAGMPRNRAFFADLNQDGYPELLGEASYGSGIVSNYIVVHDIKNGERYRLHEREYYDFYLSHDNDALSVTIVEYDTACRSYQAVPVLAKSDDGYVLELRNGSEVLYRTIDNLWGVSLFPQKTAYYIFNPEAKATKRSSLSLYEDQVFLLDITPVDSMHVDSHPVLGTYEIKDNRLYLTSYDKQYVYVFKINDDSITYRASWSSGNPPTGNFTNRSEFIKVKTRFQ